MVGVGYPFQGFATTLAVFCSVLGVVLSESSTRAVAARATRKQGCRFNLRSIISTLKSITGWQKLGFFPATLVSS